jgi:Transglycosylase SLT domain
MATATAATAVPSPSAAAPASAEAFAHPALSCQTCPYYKGDNPSQAQIAAALDAAAQRYALPRNLVRAVAWQESRWHEDVTSCDGGVGLMQIQWYYADYFNGLHYAPCGLSATTYDVYNVQGNANLGAKVLAYLKCYYDFGGPYGGTASAPADGSSAYYYQQNHPSLPYPDSAKSPSFCAAMYQNPQHPEYPALPENLASDGWSCPYTPTTGDSTLLDITLSAYNAGAGAIYSCGCIPNPAYVASVENFVPPFAVGLLP